MRINPYQRSRAFFKLAAMLVLGIIGLAGLALVTIGGPPIVAAISALSIQHLSVPAGMLGMAALAIPAHLGRGGFGWDEIPELFNATGERAYGFLRVGAAVVNGDQFYIGNDVFEIDIINTDSNVNLAAVLANTDANAVVQTSAAPASVWHVGGIIGIESERLRILEIIDTTHYYCKRGVSGTTRAGHTVPQDIFESDAVGTIVSSAEYSAHFTATASDDVITSTAHGLKNTDILTVTGGALPTGIVAGTNYFVVSATTNTFKLSATTGGSAINLTANGSGTWHRYNRIPVGLAATLTATAAIDALLDDINAGEGSRDNSQKVVAVKISTNLMMVFARERGPLALATTKVTSSGSIVWDAAAMTGGVGAVRKRVLANHRIPSAADVTAGAIYIPHDFETVAAVAIMVYTTATGARILWDGAITIVAAAGGAPGYIKLDNSGAADWSAAETINYFIAEG